jgi:hypothetical protein
MHAAHGHVEQYKLGLLEEVVLDLRHAILCFQNRKSIQLEHPPQDAPRQI